MAKDSTRITFEDKNKTLSVPRSSTVLHAALRAGIGLDIPCGGHGKCGKCKVRFTDGAPLPTEPERENISEAELEAGVRLACQARIEQACSVALINGTGAPAGVQILGGKEEGPLDVEEPSVVKEYVTLPMPNRDDPKSDLDRIEDAIGPFTISSNALGTLPRMLRESQWTGTMVSSGGHFIDFEPGDTRASNYVAAFDLGTTTIVGALIDLAIGLDGASCAHMNPQTRFGDDVLSRILYASQHANGLDAMHEAVVQEINSMLGELAGEAGIEREQIYRTTFAGNTTMLHLLLHADPVSLGCVPFAPVFERGQTFNAASFGLAMHPEAEAAFFPVIGGFIGGDTVGCILAAGLDEVREPTVLIDIGTNGEIVAAHEGRLVATSTAAGPAFEGARISEGMRATAGAIEHVLFEDDVRLGVVDDVAPVGLCGSALVDVAAELLRTGLLDARGHFRAREEMPEGIPPKLAERVVDDDGSRAFILATAEDGTDIRLTQQDVRELQLATAAIRSGTRILLQRLGLDPSGVARILLAGGFGNYLRRANAQRIGLIPPEVPEERIVYVGNASLAGARMAAACRRSSAKAEQLARKAEHVDLSLDDDFQAAFALAMTFPENA